MALQDIRYYAPVDMQKLEIKNLRLHNSIGSPVSPVSGQIYYDVATNTPKVYTGFVFRDLCSDDDDFYNSRPLSTAIDAADQLLFYDVSLTSYRRITHSNLLSSLGSVSNAYYRMIAQSGTANLDASGTDDIAISGDGTILQSVGSTTGNQTLVIDWKTQSANQVLAGPSSGGPTKPAFRSLVNNDMPSGYSPSNWNIAYSHSLLVTGNPHNISISDVGGEPYLGVPASDGYALVSTIGGVRSWTTLMKLGGQDLSSLVTSPTVGEDGYSVTWDNSNNRFTLTNVTGSSGVTASGTPVANQLAIWTGAATIKGDGNLTWDSTTHDLSIDGGATDSGQILIKYNASTYLTLKADSGGAGHIVGGNLMLYPADGGYMAIGDTLDANTFLLISDSGTTPKTSLFKVQDASTNILMNILANQEVYFPNLGSDDAEDHVLAIDDTTGLLSKRAVSTIASTSYWSKVGTDLQPATAGDDILLAQGTELLKWGDGDTYFRETSDDDLALATGGTTAMYWGVSVITFYRDLASSGSNDVGTTSARFVNTCLSGYIDFAEMAAPSAPSANTGYLYMSSADEKIYFQNSSTTYDLTAGAASLGTDGQIPYMNSGGTDFDYSDNFKWTESTHMLRLNCAVAGTVDFELAYNGTTQLRLRSLSSGADITFPTRLLIYPSSAGGYMGIGDTSDSNNFLTIQDSNTTPLTNVFRILDSSSNVLIYFTNTGASYLPSLGSDDTEDHVVAIDDSTGLLSKKAVSSIGGFWTRIGTDLRPLTSGDDILLASSTEKILFGDGDTGIYENADDILHIYVGGSIPIQVFSTNIYISGTLRPTLSLGSELGTSTVYWNNGYIARVYYGDTSTSIYKDGSGNMTFVDTHGSTSLANLISGISLNDKYLVVVHQVQHAHDGIPYIIKSLDANDIAWWQIRILVTTAFDSTAPQIRFGNSGHSNVYYLGPTSTILNTVGWKTPTLSNTPDRISGAENITTQYDDASADGTTGLAYVYFFYSKH